MTPKNYRRLTRGLFCFLFLFFLLLYLLLRGNMTAGPNGGWGDGVLVKDLGTITLSEIRSSGFILEDFDFPASTQPDAEGFNDNVLRCHALLHNEGEETIRVILSVYGTDHKNNPSMNKGLCGGFYYYPGETDPVSGNYQAFLTDGSTPVHAETGDGMKLYIREDYPQEIHIPAGESYYLDVFCWVDSGTVTFLTDEEESAYSVTVKLTSRAL